LKIAVFVRQHDIRLERFVALLDAADVRLAGAVVETRPPKKKKRAIRSGGSS
jgi:hypothetical protein